MRQSLGLSQTLQDEVHISFHPAEDIAAFDGEQEYLAEAHFTAAHGLIVPCGLIRIYQQVDFMGAETLRLKEDTALRCRDREFDLYKVVSAWHQFLRDSQLGHPLAPWSEKPAQLSDGSLLKQVLGNAEFVLKVVDVCYLLASLLGNAHQCVADLQAATRLAIFGLATSDADENVIGLNDGLAIDFVTQFARQLGEEHRVKLRALLFRWLCGATHDLRGPLDVCSIGEELCVFEGVVHIGAFHQACGFVRHDATGPWRCCRE